MNPIPAVLAMASLFGKSPAAELRYRKTLRVVTAYIKSVFRETGAVVETHTFRIVRRTADEKMMLALDMIDY
jgi:hypothetical protein